MKKKHFLAALCAIWAIMPALQAEKEKVTFPVKHEHWRGSGQGQLTIDGQGIRYDSEEDKKHQRSWEYTEIQQLRIGSPNGLGILTYEDSRLKLGRDRRFEFQLVEGQIDPELMHLLRGRLPSRVVSAVFAVPQDAFARIPAKHRHSWGGGCQGELLLAEDGVYYTSPAQKHNRFWPVDEIESLGRQSNFSFRITVREQNLLGESRNFQFQLKHPIDRRAYQRLWRKVYEPESWLSWLEREASRVP